MSEPVNKSVYVTPVLTVLGSFEQITKSTGIGLHADSTYTIPIGASVSTIIGIVESHLS